MRKFKTMHSRQWLCMNDQEKQSFICNIQDIYRSCYEHNDWVTSTEILEKNLSDNPNSMTILIYNDIPVAYFACQLMSKRQTNLLLKDEYKVKPGGAPEIELLYIPEDVVRSDNKNLYDLYITSVCVDEGYRKNKQLLIFMITEFIATTLMYFSECKNIDRIVATSISVAGRALCKKLGLEKLHTMNGGETRVTSATSKKKFLACLQKIEVFSERMRGEFS